MEYPIWHLAVFGGGFWVALIATFHVYIAHFAVGGGLFLALTETLARREKSPVLLAYVKRHTRFFMLLTMVAGGVTGVGIWFVIGLVAPQGTSTLLKIFVYAFATEWVFFLGEIVALLCAYYGFDRLDAATHLRFVWLYFIFAALSLFMINGIVGFPLTPGAWPRTHVFRDAFLNPTFWPQFFLRLAVGLSLAGLFGFVTATRIPEEKERLRMVRLSAGWTILPLIAVFAAGFWYLRDLPAAQAAMVLSESRRIAAFFKFFVGSAAAATLGALVLAARVPRRVRLPLALAVALTGWGLIGSFEFIREAARRPFLIYGTLYSNGIAAGREKALDAAGVLPTAKWARIHRVTEENRPAAGAELFQQECASCHSIGGPMNDIRPRAAGLTEEGLGALLGALHQVNPAMPPFMGTAEERSALALYLREVVCGRPADAAPAAVAPVTHADAVPPFDPRKDAYVLLAWPELGMNTSVTARGAFVLRSGRAELNALLIRRGEAPEKILQGVVIRYAVENGGPTGVLRPDAPAGRFRAGLDVPPRSADGTPAPYPLVSLEARDGKTGAVLARTSVALPVSDEAGCAACHAGGGGSGRLTGRVGRNILAAHDRLNRTELLAAARGGRPVVCASCHADASVGAAGRRSVLSLSAALHGFHANLLRGRGAEACAACHPSRPDGATRFMHGLHAERGLDCTLCHGPLEDRATALLKHELAAGKPAAARRLGQITPQLMARREIRPAAAWTQTPDCLACHKDFGRPDPSNGFNNWTKGAAERFRSRSDEAGALPCAACHGPQHALYPSRNPYGARRDVLQPLQYQKLAAPLGARGCCFVCHKKRMADELHHPGILRRPAAASDIK